MANLLTENANQILDRAMTSIKDNTQITRLTPGSKARAILSSMSAEVERLEEVLSANTVLSFVNGAGEIYLDFIGDLVGVKRGQSSLTEILSQDQIVRVSAPSGLTFGDLNRGTTITIPPGTLVTSSDSGIQFALITKAVLLPAESQAYISIRSFTKGLRDQVTKGALSKVIFTGYSTYPAQQLEVTNTSSIDPGTFRESDELYRFRISNAMLAAETGNLISVRIAALSVPAVTDVIILNFFRGIGTADLILDSQLGSLSPPTMESVRRAISMVSSLGMNINVRNPELVGLEIAVAPRMVSGLSLLDKNQVRLNIRNSVSQLVASYGLGSIVNVNGISRAILSSDKRLLDIGTPNEPLSQIVTWRDSSIFNGRQPRHLFGQNIELAIDERLTLEGTLEEAVRII